MRRARFCLPLLAVLCLAAPSPMTHLLAAPTESSARELGLGTFRALLIAVKDYQDPNVADLEAPVNDVRAIETLLRERFAFTDLRVLATPARTTREAILGELDRLAAESKADDAVLLYFAGHGVFLEDPDPRKKGEGQGYWLPSDAKKSNKAAWISNADVLDALRSMPARHVLVVSDSCFSGSLLNVRDIDLERVPRNLEDARRLASKPSRWVIASSGKDEPARDTYKEGLSAFAYTFRNVLRESRRTYLDPEVFFGDLRDGVMGVARQTPVQGAMRAAGHEGGAFVMVNRGAASGVDVPRGPVEGSVELGGGVDLKAMAARKKAKEAKFLELEATARSTAKEEHGLVKPYLSGCDADSKAMAEGYLANWGSGKAVTVDGETRMVTVPEAKEVSAWSNGCRPVALKTASASTGGGGSVTTARSATLSKFGYKLVEIKAGSFTMGSPSTETGRDTDETRHAVTLTKGFLMLDKEVSQELWEEVMGENPSATRQRFWDGKEQGACSDWGVGGNLPVHCVDWMDAVRFCNRLSEMEGLTKAYTVKGDQVTWNSSANGYRLPMEAEWEYAARAGTSGVYAGASGASEVCRYANVANPSTKSKYSIAWDVFTCDDGHVGLAPVGSFKANAWGLYDMTGNVWEWCWDWYGAYPPGSVTDPGGPQSGSSRVFRGGSWLEWPGGARVADRVWFTPSSRDFFLGLRVVRSVP